jgi:hypothetical protein
MLALMHEGDHFGPCCFKQSCICHLGHTLLCSLGDVKCALSE